MKSITLLLGLMTVQNTHSSGLYAGIKGGVSAFSGNHTSVLNSAPSFTSDKKFKYNSPLVGVQAGFLFQPTMKFFIFPEISATYNFSNAAEDLKNPQTSVVDGKRKISRSYGFGAALGAGIRFHPALGVFGKISYEMQNFKIAYTDLSFTNITKYDYAKLNKKILLGGGLISSLTNTLFVTFNYDYGFKNSSKVYDFHGINSAPTRTTTLSVKEHRLGIGLNYLFWTVT